MKKYILFFLGVLFLVAFQASASTFKVGEIYEHKAGSIFDDLYIAGGSVDVSGDVIGDAMVAGGDIAVLGNISQDISAAGGTVQVVGVIGDDVRVVGGNVSVSSEIGDDLVAAGGFVKVLSEATIAGDAVLAGGSVVMTGTISGDLKIAAEEIMINGPVNGDLIIRYGEKIEFGDDAIIAGNLTYAAEEELELPEGLIVGGEVTRVDSPFEKFEKKEFEKGLGFLLFGKFLIVLVTSLIAVLVFKRLSTKTGTLAYSKFWKNALVGFISLIVVPISVFILFATFLGSYVGVILLFTFILLLLVAKVFSGIVAGAILSKWIKKEVVVNWKWTIAGVVALHVLALIPVLGHLIAFIVMLGTFGTLLALMHKGIWANR